MVEILVFLVIKPIKNKQVYCYKHPRPALTTDALVLGFNQRTERLEILLIERKNPPFQGMFALPGGFVDMEETVEECAARELAEETELLGVPLIQMHTFSAVDRDPRGRTVSVVFFALIDNTSARVDGADDAASARWFDILELPELAFDHKQILDFAIDFAYRNVKLETDLVNGADFAKFREIITFIGRNRLLELLYNYKAKDENLF